MNIVYQAQISALNIILNTLAVAGKTLTYGEVAGLISTQARNSVFFEMLGRTMDEDHAAKKPLRCSLVVRAKTGRPGPAYYQRAAGLGCDLAKCGGENNFHDMQKALLFGFPSFDDDDDEG